MTLVLLLACTPAKDAADRASGDTSADTADAGGGDTGDADSADPDSGDSDTADSDTSGSDTGGSDTGEPDTGWMTADIVYGGTSYTLSCDATSGEGFSRLFSDALGNLPGLVSCGVEGSGAAAISFVSGTTGSWASPDDGFDARWSGPSGESLAWGVDGHVATAWQLDITRFDRLDGHTVDFAATFRSTWTDEGGAAVGTLSGAVDTHLECPSCP